jgi:hypothetical protein
MCLCREPNEDQLEQEVREELGMDFDDLLAE